MTISFLQDNFHDTRSYKPSPTTIMTLLARYAFYCNNDDMNVIELTTHFLIGGVNYSEKWTLLLVLRMHA